MAARLTSTSYSDETAEILKATSQGKNFLLSGGAGSGKTYSLVETIGAFIVQSPTARIACITYTNAATQEIEHRTSHENLHVSTIHDFLWSSIKHFQNELKIVLIDLINDEDNKAFRIISNNGDLEKIHSIDEPIEYKDYLKLRSGIISHDQIILLAEEMYSRHPKLCRILSDSYNFILVDEYQDTSPAVIKILLDHLSKNNKRNIVGFFGDSMQSIYEDGIGDLDNYKGAGPSKVYEIKKEQNRRNPTSVITLANKFRTDGLTQTPSNDTSAPNMLSDGTPEKGTAQFLYSESENIQLARNYLDWDTAPSKTKELNLTHNLIAAKAGFPELMRVYDADKILEYIKRVRDYIKEYEQKYIFTDKTVLDVLDDLRAGKTGKELTKIEPTKGQSEYISNNRSTYDFALTFPFAEISSIYIDKDMLIDDKKADQSSQSGGSNRDHLIKHLHRIQNLIDSYQSGNFNEFLRATDFSITSIASKARLKSEIYEFSNSDNKSIGDIINLAHEKGLVKKDDNIQNFIKSRNYIYKQIAEIPFVEFQNLYRYLEGHTPFSTQHKTKGREFENVMVIMDNGRWNQYNFSAFFTGDGKDTVIERTRKIVYVCGTRARRNLAFYYPSPSEDVITHAKELFGPSNVINLNDVKIHT